MGAVVVTADPDYWTIDPYWLWETMAEHFNFDDLFDVDYYINGPNCADASALYIAQQDTAQDMDDVANILDQITSTTQAADAQYSCKKTGDLPICIDFFIMEKRSAIFGGDDRDFNPDAGYRQSRIQMYVDPLTNAWTVKYNASTELLLGGGQIVADSSQSVWKPDSDVTISHLSGDPDSTKITVRFYNNFCTSRDTCPVIDATILLVRNASQPGGYEVWWKRDGYPAMGVYRYNSATNGFDKMVEDPERIRDPWIGWTALKNNFMNSIHMPPGCQLQ